MPTRRFQLFSPTIYVLSGRGQRSGGAQGSARPVAPRQAASHAAHRPRPKSPAHRRDRASAAVAAREVGGEAAETGTAAWGGLRKQQQVPNKDALNPEALRQRLAGGLQNWRQSGRRGARISTPRWPRITPASSTATAAIPGSRRKASVTLRAHFSKVIGRIKLAIFIKVIGEDVTCALQVVQAGFID